MGRYITGACRHLCDMHDGSAAALWDDRPPATGLTARLTALPGIGRHKAEVALFLLVREYGVAVIEDRPVDAALSHCSRLADVFAPEIAASSGLPAPSRWPGTPDGTVSAARDRHARKRRPNLVAAA
jgi:hypothetical protein